MATENEQKAVETKNVITAQKDDFLAKAGEKKERSLANAAQKKEERQTDAKNKFFDPDKALSDQTDFSAMGIAFDYLKLLLTGNYDKIKQAEVLLKAEKDKYAQQNKTHPLESTVNLYNDMKAGKKTPIKPTEPQLDAAGLPDEVVQAIKAELGY
eukprot:CAMPEP_0202693442 /NCGR_PEP_ID=MMETSP1385-20130828/7565_1 /ASSEMBLY_ACC=CAM_ASM_000861 /TAXON_ID=933848 /ORGANISM="Elphidium margaritaceum" /LENGTH=154 /DNA_ID=CAMNT_0049349123 /DNA_START=112 /DNA_END=576 /DNA_ORIENTATION=+